MSVAPEKWSARFWLDLAERVGSVFLYSVLTVLTTYGIADIKALPLEDWWPILFLPAVLSFVKGLLANMANPESGASWLPSPPGPEITDDSDTL